MELNQIYQGHVIDVLKEMPEGSVDCVVTSPPYWSLRDYKVEPQVWGGDVGCSHEWVIEQIDTYSSKGHWAAVYGGATGKNRFKGDIDSARERKDYKSERAFCQHCSAWRGSLGLEPSLDLYLYHLWQVFNGVRRVLKDEGTLFVNLGDSYAGSGKGIGSDHGKGVYTDEDIAKTDWKESGIPAKSLCLIPQRFAIGMVERGWILRNTIIWHKPNPMPSSAKDRFTVDFEYLYFFVKQSKYYFEQQLEAVTGNTHAGRKDGKLSPYYDGVGQFSNRQTWNRTYIPSERNARATWSIPTHAFPEAHFATFPPKLVERPILAGCPEGGVVLDPFGGSCTTAIVAEKLKRKWIMIELSDEYVKLGKERIAKETAQVNLLPILDKG